MKRADELPARIATLFAPPRGESARFQIVQGPGEVFVEEMQKEGAARIACRFPEGFVAIPWRLQSGDLRPIGSEKNADGALLLLRPDGGIEAHVMECKQTITSSKWKEVLEQLAWTVIRLLAIAGALHERVARVVLYTAFRNDDLSLDDAADPVQYKLAIEEAEASPMVRRDLQWMSPDIELPGWASRFPHVKVQKDERGHAALDLRLGG